MLWCLVTSVSLKWFHVWILWWLIRGELTLCFSPLGFRLTSLPFSNVCVRSRTWCMWVLSPAVRVGGDCQTDLRAVLGERGNSKAWWTHVLTHTCTHRVAWWPFKLSLNIRFGLIRLRGISFFPASTIPSPDLLQGCTNTSSRGRNGVRRCKYFFFALATSASNGTELQPQTPREHNPPFLRKQS